MLELRYYGASGVMPFTTSATAFRAPDDGRELWAYRPGELPAHSITSPQNIERLRHAQQPMTVFFWPRIEAVAQGGKTKHEIVVCNDSETKQTLTVQWRMAEATSPDTQAWMFHQEIDLEPTAQWKKSVTFEPMGHMANWKRNCCAMAR